ncbi:hypothetical protein ACLEB1_04205 [Escherichia coli]
MAAVAVVFVIAWHYPMLKNMKSEIAFCASVVWPRAQRGARARARAGVRARAWRPARVARARARAGARVRGGGGGGGVSE